MRQKLGAWISRCELVWRHWLFDFFVWIPSAIVLLCLFAFPQDVGVASIFLAAFAAIIVFRDMIAAQKMLCVVFVMCFMAIELRDISIEHRSQLAKEKDLQDNFANILNKNQNDFDQTVNGLNAVINNVTGGDSYPSILPQLVGGTATNKDLYLILHNNGSFPLTGVGIAMCDMSRSYYATQTSDAPQSVGPYDTVGLITTIYPVLEGGITNEYLFTINAQNGSFLETLFVRKGKYLPAVYRYEVEKLPALDPKNPNNPRTASEFVALLNKLKVCPMKDWSGTPDDRESESLLWFTPPLSTPDKSTSQP